MRDFAKTRRAILIMAPVLSVLLMLGSCGDEDASLVTVPGGHAHLEIKVIFPPGPGKSGDGPAVARSAIERVTITVSNSSGAPVIDELNCPIIETEAGRHAEADLTVPVDGAEEEFSVRIEAFDAEGLAFAGDTTVTLEAGEQSETPVEIALRPLLRTIAVTPTVGSIAIGETQQFAATGTYADETENDVTSQVLWGSDPTVATMNTSGLATAVGAGTTIIRATMDDVSGGATLTVTEGLAILRSPGVISVAATTGGPDPADQILQIGKSGGGELEWSTSVDQAWVSLTPDTGTVTEAAQDVSVSVEVGDLAPGTYSATITILAPAAMNSPQTTLVTLEVSEMAPAIARDPATLTFAATVGGEDPTGQILQISNGGGGTLTWSASADQAWLSLTPDSGSSTGAANDVSAQVAIDGLTAGTHSATITISAPGATNSPQTVSITLNLNEPPPTIWRDPTSMTFTATEGGSNPSNRDLSIRNTGGGTLQWTATDNQTWLSLNPGSGSTQPGETDEVSVHVDIDGLSAGAHSGAITISDPAATNSPRTVSITLNLAAAARPPVCDHGGPYDGVECEPVQFDASGSYDPDGTIVSYSWDFTFGQGAGPRPTNTFNDNGLYDVTLIVTDNEGYSTTCYTEVFVSLNAPPVCDGGGPYAGTAGEAVTFDGSGSHDPSGISSYEWSYGDGSYGSGAHPSHVYASAGTYTVTLRVYDDGGCPKMSECETTASISSPPGPDLIVTDIEFNPEEPLWGESVYTRARVLNQGGDGAGPSTARFWVDDAYTGEAPTSGVAAGSAVWSDWCYLGEPYLGTHTVETCADYGNVVHESNEDNNYHDETLEVLINP